MQVPFSKSSKYESSYPEVPFGFVFITGCMNPTNPQGLDQHKRKLLRMMRKRVKLVEITDRIEIYNQFFDSFSHPCPLPNHLKRTVNSGFPKYNLMVDAHFMAEMCAGILVAVADYDLFEGALTLDVSEEGETCIGMGQRLFRTTKNEIVLRDEKDIVCILCQGADEKTRVSENTRNVLYYAYAVPGIDARYLEEGLTVAADTMSQFGGGTVQDIKIF